MIQTLYPILRYRDPDAAIEFLERAFGLARHAVHRAEDGTVGHAELRFGDSILMLGPVHEGRGQSAGTGAVYVVVSDPDAHYARAVEAGAQIVYPLTDQDYGSRDYGALDPEGNRWSFGTYAPDLAQSG